MGKFEAMLGDFEAAFPDIKNKFKHDTTFVALTAPSMEGKTQLAFVMKDVLLLYFPLSEAFGGSESIDSQHIYGNFSDFVPILRDCAFADLRNLNYLVPSANDLLDPKKRI